jgi:hypothetical protein
MAIFTETERAYLHEVRGLWEAKFKHTKSKAKVQRQKMRALKRDVMLRKRADVATAKAHTDKEAQVFAAIEDSFWSQEWEGENLPNLGAEPGWEERGEFTNGWEKEEDVVASSRYWMKQKRMTPDDALVRRALLTLTKRKVLERRIHEEPKYAPDEPAIVLDDPEYRQPGTWYRLLQK